MTTLTRVLNQSDQIRELMSQAAEELSLVNTTIKEALTDGDPLNQVAMALEKTNSVKEKLQEAFEKLTSVNRTLENEVRERTMIDHQFAAAVEQEEGARNAAFHDVLTGLPNRALFQDRLEHGLAQAKRNRWTLAVMFIDLDGFKSLNDTYGHQIKVPCDVGVGNLIVNRSVAASIGIAIFPKDGATADALIASADAAMYRAKLDKSGYAFAQGNPRSSVR